MAKPAGLTFNRNKSSVRIALKPKFECTKNVVELSDIADLHGRNQLSRQSVLSHSDQSGQRRTPDMDPRRHPQSACSARYRRKNYCDGRARMPVSLFVPIPRQSIGRSNTLLPNRRSRSQCGSASVSTAISAYLRTKSSDAALWTVLQRSSRNTLLLSFNETPSRASREESSPGRNAAVRSVG